MRPYILVVPLVLAITPALAKRSKSRDSSSSYDTGRIYFHKDTYCGEEFFGSWNWETFDDPTHGQVNYVGKDAARNSNLSYAFGEKFVMRVDSNQVVRPGARGRDSVRITSNAAYGDAVIVLDVAHMPEGCATWPAFWTLSRNGPWPYGGEIDIIEGVNLNTVNLASLHTSPGCTMDVPRWQAGRTVSTDCNTAINSNQGCGTNSAKPNSYGAPFNAAGGGWYVMEKSRSRGVRVWFWSRAEYHSIPYTIKQDLGFVYPDAWGRPDADFPTTACDHGSHFDDHQMIFDTTLCGDWAGSVFSNAPCGQGSCSDFVNNNPDAFANAYWEINSLRVYTRF